MKLWTTAAIAVTAAMLIGGHAKADFKVWLPDVNFGEVAIETVGNSGFDPHADRSGEQSQTLEFEYGVTRWWQTELEFEFDAGVVYRRGIAVSSATRKLLEIVRTTCKDVMARPETVIRRVIEA